MAADSRHLPVSHLHRSASPELSGTRITAETRTTPAHWGPGHTTGSPVMGIFNRSNSGSSSESEGDDFMRGNSILASVRGAEQVTGDKEFLDVVRQGVLSNVDGEYPPAGHGYPTRG
jgi:hypothetical protein